MGEETLKPNKIYFRNLDSIRFFAAAIVLVSHCIVPFYKYLNVDGTFLGRILYTMGAGLKGVDIFFVLSGFLITYLILSESELTGSFSLKNFYLRRIFRIWPLYFAVIIFSYTLYPIIIHYLNFNAPNYSRPLFYFTFLSNFDTIRLAQHYNGFQELIQNVTWSVSIEEQFYAFWPLIFAFLPKKTWGPAILFVALTSLVFQFFVRHDQWMIYFHTISRLIDLSTGGLFAFLIIRYKGIRNYFENIKTPTLLVSFIIVIVSMLYANELTAMKGGMVLSQLYFALIFGFVIASQSMVKKPSRLELGNIGFANKLGKYTYGIYLLHPIPFRILTATFGYFHISETFVSDVILGVSGVVLGILLAVISYNYYEKPFLKLKEKFAVIITKTA